MRSCSACRVSFAAVVMTVKVSIGVPSGLIHRSHRPAKGREDSSASGRFREANLQRRLSGGESEERRSQPDPERLFAAPECPWQVSDCCCRSGQVLNANAKPDRSLGRRAQLDGNALDTGRTVLRSYE